MDKRFAARSGECALEASMFKRILKICFIAATMLFLTVSFAKAVLAPEELSMYEMRYAKKIPPFSVSSFVDGAYQSGMDEAMGDQILFSTYYKKLYNEISSLGDRVFTPLLHSIEDRYINYRGTYIYNGQLINPTVPLEHYAEGLAETAEYINEEIVGIPGVEVYLYYVENDSDINFETGEKTGTYEYFSSMLDIPEENRAALRVDDFQTYHELFYTGDHHWNHKGSYEGYCQISGLLGAGEPLVPESEVELPGLFIGSKALSTGTTHYAEHMKAYIYPLPQLEIHMNGELLPSHGELEYLLEHGGSHCSYTSVYGDDLGCAIFSVGNNQGEKLLVIGDSYDNAVLKPLAAHFSQLHSVDARYYPVQTGKELDVSDYIVENDIDKVLLIGCSAFFDIRMGMEW